MKLEEIPKKFIVQVIDDELEKLYLRKAAECLMHMTMDDKLKLRDELMRSEKQVIRRRGGGGKLEDPVG